MSILNIVLAQINPHVGDIDGNVKKIIQCVTDAPAGSVVVFPELTLTGYPPEDLLLRPSISIRTERAVASICALKSESYIVFGYPKLDGDVLLNMAGVVHRGELVFEYAKQCLPNYQVFDEKRYFGEGNKPGLCEIDGVSVGLSICEDIWDGRPLEQLQDADIVLNLNASPFHQDKQNEREQLVCARAQQVNAPIVYVNQVGGQDELVFDGGSMVVSSSGELVAKARMFDESMLKVQFNRQNGSIETFDQAISPPLPNIQMVYQALVTGVRDYVQKNRFPGVVLGLSGGIDSALTLAVAADALGPENVEAVMMPFTYTSQMSRDDAAQEAECLGVTYRSISIEPIYEAFMNKLSPVFTDMPIDTTEQNIQARTRGVILMALSNKLGYLVLTTGNKSEMAVGYATLYGDMAGGLDVLKDVPKTQVFELARYRNTISQVIPERVITRPPSAELAPDQVDEDSLPPYDTLDQILELYIEQDRSFEEIVTLGFDHEQVRRVLRLVDINEYKRRQAPIGIRISRRAFGRDRRYPITNGWPLGA